MSENEPSAEALEYARNLPRERRRAVYGARDKDVALALDARYRAGYERGIENSVDAAKAAIGVEHDGSSWAWDEGVELAISNIRALAPPQE